MTDVFVPALIAHFNGVFEDPYGDYPALNPARYRLTPQPFSTSPVPADTPEASLSGVARILWVEQGAKSNWHPGYDLCDP